MELLQKAPHKQSLARSAEPGHNSLEMASRSNTHTDQPCHCLDGNIQTTSPKSHCITSLLRSRGDTNASTACAETGEKRERPCGGEGGHAQGSGGRTAAEPPGRPVRGDSPCPLRGQGRPGSRGGAGRRSRSTPEAPADGPRPPQSRERLTRPVPEKQAAAPPRTPRRPSRSAAAIFPRRGAGGGGRRAVRLLRGQGQRPPQGGPAAAVARGHGRAGLRCRWRCAPATPARATEVGKPARPWLEHEMGARQPHGLGPTGPPPRPPAALRSKMSRGEPQSW